LTAGKAERQILKILEGTARIFDQQGCWTRYYLARDKDDKEVAIGAAEATKFCLTGAVWKSQLNLKGSDGARHGAIRFLNYVCRATYGKGLEKHGTPQDIQEFAWFPASYVNDTLLNNIGEVRNILRSATKALQKHIQQTEKVDATVAVPPPPKPRPKPAPAPAYATTIKQTSRTQRCLERPRCGDFAGVAGVKGACLTSAALMVGRVLGGRCAARG